MPCEDVIQSNQMPTKNGVQNADKLQSKENSLSLALSVKPSRKQMDAWHAAADAYIANCVHFDIKIDPSIVIALRTGWKLLRPSKEVSAEGCMLPLLGVLNSNDHITNLCLDSVSVFSGKYYSVGTGNSNARILNFILRDNASIKDLNLRHTGLDDDGLIEICEAIAVNSSLTSLNLGDNRFGERGKSLSLFLSVSIAITMTIIIIILTHFSLLYSLTMLPSTPSLLCRQSSTARCSQTQQIT